MFFNVRFTVTRISTTPQQVERGGVGDSSTTHTHQTRTFAAAAPFLTFTCLKESLFGLCSSATFFVHRASKAFSPTNLSNAQS
eukprot:scaffold3374_cov96-Alexandrium_tamarense.AAC.1